MATATFEPSNPDYDAWCLELDVDASLDEDAFGISNSSRTPQRAESVECVDDGNVSPSSFFNRLDNALSLALPQGEDPAPNFLFGFGVTLNDDVGGGRIDSPSIMLAEEDSQDYPPPPPTAPAPQSVQEQHQQVERSDTQAADPEPSFVPQPSRAGRAPRGGRRNKQNAQPVEDLVRKAFERCEELGYLLLETVGVEQMREEYDLKRTHVKPLRDGGYLKSAKFDKKNFPAICAEFNGLVLQGREKEKGLASTLNSTATRNLLYHFGISAGEGRSKWGGGLWTFNFPKALRDFEAYRK